MTVRYASLESMSGVRDDVGALLVGTFGPAKAGSWCEGFEAAAAGEAPGWVALDADDAIVGVALGELPSARMSAFVCAKANAHGLPVLPEDVLGTCSYLAVRDEHRGRGIGSELARRVLRGLVERGANVLFALSWQSGADTSDAVFRSLGLREIELIGDDEPDPYRQDTACDACGTSPCSCEAMLYAVRVSLDDGPGPIEERAEAALRKLLPRWFVYGWDECTRRMMRDAYNAASFDRFLDVHDFEEVRRVFEVLAATNPNTIDRSEDEGILTFATRGTVWNNVIHGGAHEWGRHAVSATFDADRREVSFVLGDERIWNRVDVDMSGERKPRVTSEQSHGAMTVCGEGHGVLEAMMCLDALVQSGGRIRLAL